MAYDNSFTDFVPQLRTRDWTKDMKLQRTKRYAFTATADSMVKVTKTMPQSDKISEEVAVGTGKFLTSDRIPDWNHVPPQVLDPFEDNCEQTWISPVALAPIGYIEHRLKSHLNEDETETLFRLLKGKQSDERNTIYVSDFIKFKYTPDEYGASLVWQLRQEPPAGTKTSALGTAFRYYTQEPDADQQTSTHA